MHLKILFLNNFYILYHCQKKQILDFYQNQKKKISIAFLFLTSRKLPYSKKFIIIFAALYIYELIISITILNDFDFIIAIMFL